MGSIYDWFRRQFGKLVLLPHFFRVIAKEWLNILFGETLVGIAFLLWWSLAGPSNAKLIAVFVAGYYAWRADHIRLMPKLEVKDFTRQTTETFDHTGKKERMERIHPAPASVSDRGKRGRMPWTSYVYRNDDRIDQGLGASGKGSHVLGMVAQRCRTNHPLPACRTPPEYVLHA